MPGDILQADYEGLESIATMFGAQAESSAAMFTDIRQHAEPLIQGDWRGEGFEAFRGQIEGQLYPALERLIEALSQAQSLTSDVSALLREAEEEAAAVFQGQQAAMSGGSSGNNQSFWNQWGEWVHGALDVVGVVPGLGEIADGTNALIYLAEGRYLEAGISAAAMIPIVGDVGKAGKWAVKGGKEVFEEVAETGTSRALREGGETLTEKGAKESDSFLRFGELEPNAHYTRNGYDYDTDDLGRVNHVSAEALRLEKAPRNSHQTEVGHMGIEGDDGGHLIGSRFGGSSEGVNLVPQNGNLNKGAWKVMENSWAKAIENGQKVENVDIRLRYNGESTRPEFFEVRYQIDGVPQPVRTFRNQPGG